LEIDTVSCEGAPAVKSTISANAYIFKFNRQELKGVMPGDAVTLTVKLTFFDQDGKQALTQESDTVRVKQDRARDTAGSILSHAT
jgi:hypothetical protein